MPAYRFIIVLFSQHHQFIIIRQTMGMMGQIPATDTDRMYFRHIFGHSHQIRHRPERFTGIIHIQPSDYYADTVICQCFTYRHYIRIKNWASSIPTTSTSPVNNKNITRIFHRRTTNRIRVMRYHIFIRITHIDFRFKYFHLFAGQTVPASTAGSTLPSYRKT